MSLYVGRRCDTATLKATADYALLEPEDFRRHAVCFGMTGSGKTGLCISVLEELAMAGVPLLVIDPKGDMANLALAFAHQDAASFQPWIDPADAARAGRSVEQQAEATSQRWREGLAAWNVGAERIAAFTERARVTVYTPGSTAGVPIDVLGSLGVPPDVGDDGEALSEVVRGTVSGLLELVGIEADPIADREHILLARLLETSWANGQAIDLPTLVLRLVDPPFDKVGVFPVDTFFPRDARLQLAMRLNGVLAAPGFEVWQQGVRLDPAALLAREEGRTPVRVFYLAHLAEGQRRFFVTLLLNQLVAWARRQPGTSGLSALLYFDEVYGFLPPHPANPPTKRPVLTLMKQARAVGLGVMLVTQNPVDVDYAAMSNAGLWWIGRLQTKQDRDRVLDGLAGAAGAIDRGALEDWLSRLPPWTFVLRNAAKADPELVHSRWAVSYLRGPLTKDEVRRLRPAPAPALGTAASAPSPAASAPSPAASKQSPAASAPSLAASAQSPAAWAPSLAASASSTAPAPSPAAPAAGRTAASVSVSEPLLGAPPPTPKAFDTDFVDPSVVFSARLAPFFEKYAEPHREDGAMVWRPGVLARLKLTFDEGRDFVYHRDEVRLFFPIGGHQIEYLGEPPFEPSDFLMTAPAGLFAQLPGSIDDAAELDALKRRVIDEVYRGETELMWRHAATKLSSHAGETRDAFKERVRAAARSKADSEIAALKAGVDRKVAALEQKRDQLQRTAERYKTEAKSNLATEVASAGETMFALFFGGSRTTAVSSAMRRRQTTMASGQRADDADRQVAELERQVYDLEAETAEQVKQIEERAAQLVLDIEEASVRLEREDLRVERFGLCWIPVTRPL